MVPTVAYITFAAAVKSNDRMTQLKQDRLEREVPSLARRLASAPGAGMRTISPNRDGAPAPESAEVGQIGAIEEPLQDASSSAFIATCWRHLFCPERPQWEVRSYAHFVPSTD